MRTKLWSTFCKLAMFSCLERFFFFSKQLQHFHSSNFFCARPTTFKKSATPVCLPTGPQDSPPPKTRALFSGWGKDENYTEPDELKYNWVHIISLDECKERGAKPTETNLCSYDKTTRPDGNVDGHPIGPGLVYR